MTNITKEDILKDFEPVKTSEVAVGTMSKYIALLLVEIRDELSEIKKSIRDAGGV